MTRPRLLLELEYVGSDPAQALRPDLSGALKHLLRVRNWRCRKITDAGEGTAIDPSWALDPAALLTSADGAGERGPDADVARAKG